MRVFKLVLVFLLFVCAEARAVTYYVNKAGNDANSCATAQSATDANAKLTVAGGLGCLSAGDTLIVGDGVYTEGINDTLPAGTSAAARTTIQAETNKQAILRPSTGVGPGALHVFYSTKSHTVVDGLTIDGVNIAASGSLPFRWHLTATGVILKNSEVMNGDSNCVTVQGSVTNSLIQNNKIHDCGIGPTFFHGVYLWNTGHVVERNEIYDISGMGVHLFLATGGVSNNIIRYNYIHDNGSRGILLSSGNNNIAHHNILVANGFLTNADAIGIGSGATVANNSQVYNNTLYANYRGIIVASGHTNSRIKNNYLLSNTNSNTVTNSGSGTEGACATFGNQCDTTTSKVVNVATNRFSPVVGSALLNAGVNVGFAFNGSAPTVGALDPPRQASAEVGTISSNELYLTWTTNLFPPLRNITNTCTPTVDSADVTSVSTTLTGTAVTKHVLPSSVVQGQVVAVRCPGNAVTDSALIGGTLNAESLSFDPAPVLAVSNNVVSAPSTDCVYYFGPTSQGANDGTSSADRWAISTIAANYYALSFGSANRVACLDPGTYTGAVIAVPNTVIASVNFKAIIRATDPADPPLLDGNGSRPVNLEGQYVELWDMNVKDGDNSTAKIHSNCTNCAFRRLVVWNESAAGSPLGNACIDVQGSNNLVEDSAAFGACRKTINFATSANNNTGRRLFGRWEGNPCSATCGNPTGTIQVGYGQNSTRIENSIFTRDHMAAKGTITEPEGMITMFRTDNTVLEGNILYANVGDTVSGAAFMDATNDAGSGAPINSSDNVAINGLVAFVPSGISMMGQRYASNTNYPAGSNNTVTNAWSIGGNTSTLSTRSWSGTITSVANVAALPDSIFNLAGGRFCKQIVNGTVTTTALWPWPMNQRIIDAMTTAGYTGADIVDVTAKMESIFGAIPAACSSGTVAEVVTQTNWTINSLILSGGALDRKPLPATPVNTTTPIKVVKGGAFIVAVQLDRTGAEGAPFGAQLRYSKNNIAGSYTAIPDTCGADGICFYGPIDLIDDGIPAEATALNACLDGALTAVPGAVQRTSNAVPNVDPAQNGCVTLGAVLKFDDTVSDGDIFYFKYFNQDGTAFTYTDAATARVTVKGYSANAS